MMITAASQRCLEFLNQTEVIEHDTTERLIGLLRQFSEHIQDKISALPPNDGSVCDLFTVAYPGKDETRETAKAWAWRNHIHDQTNDVIGAYYAATPYSPYFGTEETFDEQILEGNRELSDKDIWSITFPHPYGHYYIAKYMPGARGQGFGFKYSVHKNPGLYDSTLASIARGKRYPLN